MLDKYNWDVTNMKIAYHHIDDFSYDDKNKKLNFSTLRALLKIQILLQIVGFSHS